MAFEGVPRGPAPVFNRGRFKGQAKDFLGVELRMELAYRYDPALGLSKRRLNAHMRVANRTVLLYWHRFMRPKHFTNQGGSKYKYQRRTYHTQKLKKEHFGHNLPIRSKGVAQSETGTVKSLRVTANRGTLVMKGPWYLGQRVERKAGGLSPDLKDELVRIDLKDGQVLAELGSKILAKRIAQEQARGVGKRTIKG